TGMHKSIQGEETESRWTGGRKWRRCGTKAEAPRKRPGVSRSLRAGVTLASARGAVEAAWRFALAPRWRGLKSSPSTVEAAWRFALAVSSVGHNTASAKRQAVSTVPPLQERETPNSFDGASLQLRNICCPQAAHCCAGGAASGGKGATWGSDPRGKVTM